jgi:hypothetical protein
LLILLIFFWVINQRSFRGAAASRPLRKKHVTNDAFREFFPSIETAVTKSKESKSKRSNANGNDDDYQQQKTLAGLALGIGGDQTQHLLKRLEDGGEFPLNFYPKFIVLHIGTNK